MRLASAATAAAIVCASGIAPAHAESAPHLVEQNCVTYEATPTSQLVNAWQLHRLDMETVWRMATGKGVRIAVIDTGVSTLGSTYFSQGEDRVVTFDMIPPEANPDGDPSIDCKHGTVVTSILAAGRRPDGGPIASATNFAGIAPESTVYAYRTLKASQTETEEGQPKDEEDLTYTIAAVRQAIEDDVDIINLSMVTFEDPKLGEFEAVIEDAISKGIVVVAAAGNQTQGRTDIPYPAGFDGVISVGISNQEDAGDPATHISRVITVGAPGKNLVALWPSRETGSPKVEDQAYVTNATGTSFAAPVVSGVVALMLQYERDVHGKELTPAEVKERLVATADRSGVRAPDPFVGFGIVNPLRALTNTTGGTAVQASAEPSEQPRMPLDTPDRTPLISMVGLGVGIGAIVAVLLGLVAAVAIPAARRRR